MVPSTCLTTVSINAPSNQSLESSQNKSISGITLSTTGVLPSENLQLIITSTGGNISVGTGFSTSFTFVNTLSQLNQIVSSLQYKAGTGSSGSIIISLNDSPLGGIPSLVVSQTKIISINILHKHYYAAVSSPSSTNIGLIVGVVVGGVCFFFILGILLLIFFKKRKEMIYRSEKRGRLDLQLQDEETIQKIREEQERRQNEEMLASKSQLNMNQTEILPATKFISDKLFQSIGVSIEQNTQYCSSMEVSFFFLFFICIMKYTFKQG